MERLIHGGYQEWASDLVTRSTDPDVVQARPREYPGQREHGQGYGGRGVRLVPSEQNGTC